MDYNCKHRLLASVAYILPSILSLWKFSHFNQCRISRHLLSLLATWFPRLFVLLRRTAQSFGPFEIQRSRFSWDSYSAEYVMRNRLRRDGCVKERKRMLLIQRARVSVSSMRAQCVVRVARYENSKLEGNLIIKQPCCLPSRPFFIKWLRKRTVIRGNIGSP